MTKKQYVEKIEKPTGICNRKKKEYRLRWFGLIRRGLESALLRWMAGYMFKELGEGGDHSACRVTESIASNIIYWKNRNKKSDPNGQVDIDDGRIMSLQWI